MPDEKKEPPKVNLRFLFGICNDIGEMKNFYTDLMGMQEVAYMDDDNFGWLAYQCDGFQFMFFRVDNELAVPVEWTCQPGYEGGTLEAISWAIEIPEAEFADRCETLKKAGVKTFSETPEWRQDSYWGFSVLDPMGNTVEVYTRPKEKPESGEWPG